MLDARTNRAQIVFDAETSRAEIVVVGTNRVALMGPPKENPVREEGVGGGMRDLQGSSTSPSSVLFRPGPVDGKFGNGPAHFGAASVRDLQGHLFSTNTC